MNLGLGLENVDWFSMLGGVFYWAGYILLGLVVGVVMFGAYYLMGFQVKAKVIPLYGGGESGSIGIGKPKNNRFKWVDGRKAWKPLFPLFNKLKVEPFEPEYIYPGNNVLAFKFGETFVPGKYEVKEDGKNLKAQVSPVPYYIRNWQSLAHKKTNQEYAQQGFWEDNKMFIYGVITVAICCAVALATVWLTYKFAGGGTTAINNLADSIQNFQVIPGK